MMRGRNTGFTLLELVIVISILIILLALLLPALGMLRRAQRRSTTAELMNQMSLAMTSYLDRWPRVGDGSDPATTFATKPWLYLGARWLAAGKEPMLELRPTQLASGDLTSWAQADAASATLILDAFDMPLRFAITEQTVGGRVSTDTMELRSTVGTPDDATDDLVIRFSSRLGGWDWVRK